MAVHCHGVVHLIEVAAGIYRIEHQLIVSIPQLCRQLCIETKSIKCQSAVLVHHSFKLTVVCQAVGLFVQHFRGDPSVVFRIEGEDTGNLLCVGCTKLLCSPLSGMFHQVLRIKLCGIPGHIEKETDRVLHRFEVSYVDDPELFHPMLIGKVHLFPYPLNGIDVDPFGIARSSHIIEMVIDAVTPFSGFGIHAGQLTDVPPVVVAQEERHIIRHPHPVVIVILYLFVQCPYLWCLFRFFAGHLADDLSLIRHDLFQKSDVHTLFHRFVAITPHAHGHHLLPVATSFDAISPRLLQCIGVFVVVPDIGEVVSLHIPVPVGLCHRHRLVV